jgi:tetratricopeptide (TPR) repeat protein
MATTYSWTGRGPLSAIMASSSFLAVAWSVVTMPLQSAEPPPAADFNPTNYVAVLYWETRQRFLADTNNLEAAWQFARRCFDRGEFAAHDDERAAIAKEGIGAARQAVALQRKSAEGHFYLAMNLGQLARTRLLGALKLVDEMEVEFKASIQLDPKFDFAGAHRSLGTLYREAPGWPASVGDRAKARVHVQKAVEISPDYPDNQLTLLESYLGWGEREQVARQISKVSEILAKARLALTGPEWVIAWRDWDERWKKIKAKAGVLKLQSPAQKD